MRLLYFHAEWCDPCKRVGPLVEALAGKAGVPVVHVDVDQPGELQELHRVMSVPTVVVESAGEPVYTGVGAGCVPELGRILTALA